ncbi:MAG: TIGR01244 family sulfur transferase [Roseobacter sp.]
MDIRQLTPRFYVAPQISPEDIPSIAEAGIQLIICNRPDFEVPPSHQASALENAATEAGLMFAVQPLTHQTMVPEVIEANRTLAEECEGATLAYCASGTRSTIAWALGAAKDMPIDDIIQAARNAGYDLANLRQTLQAASRL